MDEFPPSQDFPAKERNRSIEEDLLQPRYGKDLNLYEEGDKLEPIRGHRPPEGTRRRGFWIAATIVLLVIVIALSSTIVVLLSRQPTSTSQNIPPTATPPIPTPSPSPSPSPPSSTLTINLQLNCQHCEQPGVVAFIKNYSSDPTGSTSLTVTFTNHTNSAVDMKVDTIKLLDQNGNLAPILSSDPYVGVSVGQTVPTIINFRLTPQPGTKYTFSIVMEEANVFANFYQSPAFSFS
jgi:hypothetical protein